VCVREKETSVMGDGIRLGIGLEKKKYPKDHLPLCHRTEQ